MMRNFILLFLLFGIGFSIQAQTLQPNLRVEFEGNKIFSSDTLLKKLNVCVARHSNSEEEYDVRLFNYCLLKDVLGFLQSQGYLKAKFGEPKVQKNEQSLKVVFPIEEGLPYRLGNINIQGAKAFTSEQMFEKLNLKTGDIADYQTLSQWLYESMKKLYEDKGYAQIEFDLEPILKPATENEGVADFEITVDEGLIFTIKTIKFVGNRKTSDQILRSTLLIKEDELFNQQHLVESVEKLNALGLFEKIDKDRDVEIRTDVESPLLQINILIREKELF